MSTGSVKNILISGYIGFQNFGDDAMLSIISSHFKQKGYNVSALSALPKKTEEDFQIKAYNYKNISEMIKAVKNSDCVVSGGGNLIQNETSNKSLFYYCFIMFLAKLFKKKLLLISQGIGPVKGSFPLAVSKFILKKADLIVVRDVFSLRLLKKWGIHAYHSYDVFWNYPTKTHTPQKIVGIQIRNYEKAYPEFFANLTRYVDMFFSEYEIRIYSFQNSQDASDAYKLEKQIKTRNRLLNTKVILYRSIEQMAEEFSKLEYLIAMRLHANILGLKTGVKVLPVSYGIKIRNLAYEFDLACMEASEDVAMHPYFQDLTTNTDPLPVVQNAIQKGFNWDIVDKVIKE